MLGNAMNGGNFHKLAESLQQFILRSYTEAELAQLVFFEMDGMDLYNIANGTNFNHLTFSLILWTIRQGPECFLKLAEAASRRRPELDEGDRMAREIRAAIYPDTTATATDGPSGDELRLLDQLTTLAGMFETIEETTPPGAERVRSMRDLSNNVRTLPIEKLNLPDRFHLSESAGERLAAVLALEKVPDVKFLRWLSERVIVERAFGGQLAAQALTYAALRFSQEDLKRVKLVVRDATELLKEMQNRMDGERELQQVLEIIDKRLAGALASLPAVKFDELLNALTASFDWESLEELCEKLDVRLRRLVQQDASIEYTAYMVIRTAEQAGWEGDLIQAAFQQRQDNPKLEAIYNTYRSSGGGNDGPLSPRAVATTPGTGPPVGSRKTRLRRVLLELFPNRSQLAMLVNDALDVNLNTIAGESDLTTTAFELIQWMHIDQAARLRPFLDEALLQRPNSEELASLSQELFGDQ